MHDFAIAFRRAQDQIYTAIIEGTSNDFEIMKTEPRKTIISIFIAVEKFLSVAEPVEYPRPFGCALVLFSDHTDVSFDDPDTPYEIMGKFILELTRMAEAAQMAESRTAMILNPVTWPNLLSGSELPFEESVHALIHSAAVRYYEEQGIESINIRYRPEDIRVELLERWKNDTTVLNSEKLQHLVENYLDILSYFNGNFDRNAFGALTLANINRLGINDGFIAPALGFGNMMYSLGETEGATLMSSLIGGLNRKLGDEMMIGYGLDEDIYRKSVCNMAHGGSRNFIAGAFIKRDERIADEDIENWGPGHLALAGNIKEKTAENFGGDLSGSYDSEIMFKKSSDYHIGRKMQLEFGSVALTSDQFFCGLTSLVVASPNLVVGGILLANPSPLGKITGAASIIGGVISGKLNYDNCTHEIAVRQQEKKVEKLETRQKDLAGQLGENAEEKEKVQKELENAQTQEEKDKALKKEKRLNQEQKELLEKIKENTEKTEKEKDELKKRKEEKDDNITPLPPSPDREANGGYNVEGAKRRLIIDLMGVVDPAPIMGDAFSGPVPLELVAKEMKLAFDSIVDPMYPPDHAEMHGGSSGNTTPWRPYERLIYPANPAVINCV